MAKIKNYRLLSDQHFHTPGMVEWAIAQFVWTDQQPVLLRIFTEGYGLPEADARKLLSGEVPYQVMGDEVHFSIHPIERLF